MNTRTWIQFKIVSYSTATPITKLSVMPTVQPKQMRKFDFWFSTFDIFAPFTGVHESQFIYDTNWLVCICRTHSIIEWDLLCFKLYPSLPAVEMGGDEILVLLIQKCHLDMWVSRKGIAACNLSNRGRGCHLDFALVLFALTIKGALSTWPTNT